VLLQHEALRQGVAEVDAPDAEALLLPDTAVSTLDALESLTRQRGKPVLTANQVTIWQALRLAGCEAADPRLGILAEAALPRVGRALD
jgi:maleate cis-trans isomerase